jgi:hypothetical protein
MRQHCMAYSAQSRASLPDLKHASRRMSSALRSSPRRRMRCACRTCCSRASSGGAAGCRMRRRFDMMTIPMRNACRASIGAFPRRSPDKTRDFSIGPVRLVFPTETVGSARCSQLDRSSRFETQGSTRGGAVAFARRRHGADTGRRQGSDDGASARDARARAGRNAARPLQSATTAPACLAMPARGAAETHARPLHSVSPRNAAPLDYIRSARRRRHGLR